MMKWCITTNMLTLWLLEMHRFYFLIFPFQNSDYMTVHFYQHSQLSRNTFLVQPCEKPLAITGSIPLVIIFIYCFKCVFRFAKRVYYHLQSRVVNDWPAAALAGSYCVYWCCLSPATVAGSSRTPPYPERKQIHYKYISPGTKLVTSIKVQYHFSPPCHSQLNPCM